MKLKIVSEEDFSKLLDSIDEIKRDIKIGRIKPPLRDIWLDGSEVCTLLKVSKRTLQKYRDTNQLPYSQISGKIYFKAADIQKHLEKNYIKSIEKK